MSCVPEDKNSASGSTESLNEVVEGVKDLSIPASNSEAAEEKEKANQSAETSDATTQAVNTTKANSCNLFVKNLDPSFDTQALTNLFQEFGKIQSCNIAYNDNGVSKGYAFVKYDNPESAKKAMEKLSGRVVLGNQIFINIHIPKKDRTSAHHHHHNHQNHHNYHNHHNVNHSTGHIRQSPSPNPSIPFSSTSYPRYQRNNYGGGFYSANIGYQRYRNEENSPETFTTVYVSNLKPGFDEEKLKELFSTCGTVVSVHRPRTNADVHPKVFAFVQFTTHEEAVKALSTLQSKSFEGEKLFISRAQRKNDATRHFNPYIPPLYMTDYMAAGDINSHADDATPEADVASLNGKPGVPVPMMLPNAGGIPFPYFPLPVQPPLRHHQGYNLFVRNFGTSFSESDLWNLFQKFGNILSVKIMFDNEGRSRNFGFVSFQTEESANSAIAELDGFENAGKKLSVSFAQRKENNDYSRNYNYRYAQPQYPMYPYGFQGPYVPAVASTSPNAGTVELNSSSSETKTEQTAVNEPVKDGEDVAAKQASQPLYQVPYPGYIPMPVIAGGEGGVDGQAAVPSMYYMPPQHQPQAPGTDGFPYDPSMMYAYGNKPWIPYGVPAYNNFYVGNGPNGSNGKQKGSRKYNTGSSSGSINNSSSSHNGGSGASSNSMRRIRGENSPGTAGNGATSGSSVSNFHKARKEDGHTVPATIPSHISNLMASVASASNEAEKNKILYEAIFPRVMENSALIEASNKQQKDKNEAAKEITNEILKFEPRLYPASAGYDLSDCADGDDEEFLIAVISKWASDESKLDEAIVKVVKEYASRATVA